MKKPFIRIKSIFSQRGEIPPFSQLNGRRCNMEFQYEEKKRAEKSKVDDCLYLLKIVIRLFMLRIVNSLISIILHTDRTDLPLFVTLL